MMGWSDGHAAEIRKRHVDDCAVIMALTWRLADPPGKTPYETAGGQALSH